MSVWVAISYDLKMEKCIFAFKKAQNIKDDKASCGYPLNTQS